MNADLLLDQIDQSLFKTVQYLERSAERLATLQTGEPAELKTLQTHAKAVGIQVAGVRALTALRKEITRPKKKETPPVSDSDNTPAVGPRGTGDLPPSVDKAGERPVRQPVSPVKTSPPEPKLSSSPVGTTNPSTPAEDVPAGDPSKNAALPKQIEKKTKKSVGVFDSRFPPPPRPPVGWYPD